MTEQMKALGVIKKACSTVTPRTRLSEQSFKMKGNGYMTPTFQRYKLMVIQNSPINHLLFSRKQKGPKRESINKFPCLSVY